MYNCVGVERRGLFFISQSYRITTVVATHFDEIFMYVAAKANLLQTSIFVVEKNHDANLIAMNVVTKTIKILVAK